MAWETKVKMSGTTTKFDTFMMEKRQRQGYMLLQKVKTVTEAQSPSTIFLTNHFRPFLNTGPQASKNK